MFSSKEYQPEDYVFVDENGNEYISTPKYDVMGTLAWVCCICMMIPILMSIVMYLTLQ